jgi:hypothetical protein
MRKGTKAHPYCRWWGGKIMREHKGFLFLCLLFGLGLCTATYQEQSGGSMIGAFLWVVLLGVAGLALLLAALTRVLKRTHLSWPQRLVPLAGWGTPLLASYLLSSYLTRLDRVPNWLVLSNHEAVGYAGFDFKPDGRYKYTTGSPLGLFYSYGHYVRRDSLLHLYPELGQEVPFDTLLIIRPYSAAAPFFDSLAHVVSRRGSNPYHTIYYILSLKKFPE